MYLDWRVQQKSWCLKLRGEIENWVRGSVWSRLGGDAGALRMPCGWSWELGGWFWCSLSIQDAQTDVCVASQTQSNIFLTMFDYVWLCSITLSEWRASWMLMIHCWDKRNSHSSICAVQSGRPGHPCHSVAFLVTWIQSALSRLGILDARATTWHFWSHGSICVVQTGRPGCMCHSVAFLVTWIDSCCPDWASWMPVPQCGISGHVDRFALSRPGVLDAHATVWHSWSHGSNLCCPERVSKTPTTTAMSTPRQRRKFLL